jgi:hypothetical protein
VFSFKNDLRIPERATKSKAHAQKTLHAVFNEHDALTTVQNNGATKGKKDIHSRWKTCVSDVYDDVELQFPDAKLAGMLCPGGPIRYGTVPGSGVTRAFKAKFGGMPPMFLVLHFSGSCILLFCYDASNAQG